MIDSGFRVHLTSFTRETQPTPSSFTQRLRKHLRTRRLTSVEQLGVDRILKLTFSDGQYHLFLEFFAGGNVILTDAEMHILAVLRTVIPEDGGPECKIGATYAATVKPRSGTVTRERVVGALESALVEATAVTEPGEEAVRPGKKFQKKKKKVDTALKKVLGQRIPEFSPVLVEHALLGVGVDPLMKAEQVVGDDAIIAKVLEAFKEAEEIVRDLTGGEGTKKGYIIAKQPQHASASAAPKEAKEKKSVGFGSVEEEAPAEKVQEEGEAKGLVFDDFHPFLPRQFVGVPGVKTLEYEGFNKTVDTFFSSIEAQKLESRLREREIAAKKRLEGARADHAKRVEVLRDVQDLNTRKAQTLEANSLRVEEAIAAVNGLIAQGMDWVQAARLIEGEQKRGNAVAEIIKLPLKLYDNTVTLELRELDSNPDDEKDDGFGGFSDSEDEADHTDNEGSESGEQNKPLSIDVDLSLSAYANARAYYDQKRTAAEKETKTLQSSAKALKSTERKITTDLKKALKTEKQLLRPVRQPLWFEKFLFFISSDGYLVLGGRDGQQNERIYKRHFKRGDVYVHADIQGATSVIVKNNPATPNAPIPPSTLQQAGTLVVATSVAWDSKAVMSAWWVGFEQVFKTAPGTGEYLPLGVFDVNGKKNFLPPAQLVLGYGVLWRVDEESRKRHGRHRVDEDQKPTQDVEDDEKNDKYGEEENQEEAYQEEEAEEDSDEEFPDAKLDSDDDDEFPDVKLESEDEAEEHQEQDSEEEEEEEAVPATSTAKVPADKVSPGPSSSTPASGRHLSAKQRRDIKNGKALTPTTSTPQTATIETSRPTSAAATGGPKPLPRGKRTKAKRAAQKYSLQDEDDREVALSLLGISNPAAAAATEAKEEAKEDAEVRKARLRAQHARAQATGLAEESKRRAALEAGEEDEDEDEGMEAALDSLIPDTRPEDVLLDAIPVCAPWGAMGKYKYRVKIQPGAAKKGKALRDVWNMWVGTAGKMKPLMAEKERELVSGWKDSEMVACVGVSKIKVFTSAGGAAGGKDGKKKAPPPGKAKRGKGSKKK